MTRIHLCLVILFNCGRLIIGMSESNYLQTQVSDESEECLGILKNRKEMEIPNTKSAIQCSLQCTNHPICRRFMYDKLSYSCTLFYSGENCVTRQGTVDQRLCFKQKHICNEEQCTRCPIGYYGDRCSSIIKDCSDGKQKPIEKTKKKTLTYIEPQPGLLLEVFCRFDTGITLVQDVNIKCKAANFNRPWSDYKNGFGHNTGNYWLGLRNIYTILQGRPQELHIFLEDENDWFQSIYDHVRLHQNYFNISIGNNKWPNHNLGNLFHSHDINDLPFSTYDQDFSNGCPIRQQHGWWFLNDSLCSNVKVTDDEIVWLDQNDELRSYKEFSLRLKWK